jgi:hypothetical protein
MGKNSANPVALAAKRNQLKKKEVDSLRQPF